MNDYIKLFSLISKNWKKIGIAIFSMAMVAFFTATFTLLIQPIMDHLFLKGSKEAPVAFIPRDLFLKIFHIQETQLEGLLPFLLVMVFLGKGFFTFLSSYKMTSIGLTVVKSLRDKLYSHLIDQPINFFINRPTGELISRVTNDIDRIQTALSETLGDLIRESFTLIGLLFVIFYQDWKLAFISLLLIPMASIPIIGFGKKLKRKGLLGQKKMADISNIIFETVKGNRIVKAFNMEKFEKKKFLKLTDDHFKVHLKMSRISSFNSPFMEFLGAFVAAFILWVGTRKIVSGAVTPGQFTSFLTAMFLMYAPVKRLSKVNFNIQQALVGLERIEEIMKEQPEVKERGGLLTLPRVKGLLEFRNVSFSYSDKNFVLKDVSFKAEPGELVAIVGLSGAGKTTLINLIPRFYEMNLGEITIDNYDIRSITLSSLRAQIGLVTQDIILFNDTVKNNIVYGLENISEVKIVESAKAAMAHDFIMNLSDGYETVIGEGGQILSLGQRQRIAIARAILKDPPILILDEATSQLDSESERAIQMALENLMKNRTTIVIAHRLSTIRKADKILVIDKGTIVEQGTHESLLKKRGIYAHLYVLQFPELLNEQQA
ncbi:MAG: ABC transporter transmembrane domain-containing protein [Acidobacteriota bacterium]